MDSSKYLKSMELNKQELPKQPVPDLHQTAQRYLRSLKPLLNEQEYLHTEKVVKDFVSDDGIGLVLQKKLMKRYEKTDNWMNDWYTNASYLGNRVPVLVHSNPGTVGPPQEFNSLKDVYKFAAQLIVAVSKFNDLVKMGNIEQESAGGAPLDIQPYALILGSCRVPGAPVDTLVHTDDSQHVIILRNNNIFKLSVVDDDGTLLDESKLIPAIEDIFGRSETDGIPIGILTGQQRDLWAEDFETLKNIGGNSAILKDIETALFILCLDKDLPREEFEEKNNISVRAKQALTGFSIDTNAGNRWHDKVLQFILSSDGFVGTENEHSVCEGGFIARILDFVLKYIENGEKSGGEEKATVFPKGELLTFEVNDAIEKSVRRATKFVDELCRSIETNCFLFTGFGSEAIKKLRLSPDSFIQIALQVTSYKLHRKPVAHYESAGLRRFKKSRTEAIRSTCSESVEFAKIMSHGGSIMEKKGALLKAVNAHKRIVMEAITGGGVDRHLFGLKMIAQEEQIDLPAIFKDEAFSRSCTWILKTSQMSNSERQKDEIIALSSIHNTNDITDFIQKEDKLILKIDPDIRNEYLEVYYLIMEKNLLISRRNFRVKNLPPVILEFVFPPDYPSSEPPDYKLTISWLPPWEISRVCCRLDEIWREYRGCEILFLWSDFLKSEILKFLNYEESLDVTFLFSISKAPDDPVHFRLLEMSDERAINNAIYLHPMIHLSQFDKAKKEEEFAKNYHKCGICFDEHHGKKSMKFWECGHVFCRSCIERYIAGKIKEGSVRSIRCPGWKCLEEVQSNEIRKYCPDFSGKYEELLMKVTLNTMENVTICPRRLCQYSVIHEADDALARCPACDYSFCRYCRKAFHGVSPCEITQENSEQLTREYQQATGAQKKVLFKKHGREQIQRVVETKLTKDYIKVNTKKCPNCSTTVEKSEGCNKIVCLHCQAMFCWLCGEKIDSKNPYKHFSDVAEGSKCYGRLFEGMRGIETLDFDEQLMNVNLLNIDRDRAL